MKAATEDVVADHKGEVVVVSTLEFSIEADAHGDTGLILDVNTLGTFAVFQLLVVEFGVVHTAVPVFKCVTDGSLELFEIDVTREDEAH